MALVTMWSYAHTPLNNGLQCIHWSVRLLALLSKQRCFGYIASLDQCWCVTSRPTYCATTAVQRPIASHNRILLCVPHAVPAISTQSRDVCGCAAAGEPLPMQRLAVGRGEHFTDSNKNRPNDLCFAGCLGIFGQLPPAPLFNWVFIA